MFEELRHISSYGSSCRLDVEFNGRKIEIKAVRPNTKILQFCVFFCYFFFFKERLIYLFDRRRYYKLKF